MDWDDSCGSSGNNMPHSSNKQNRDAWIAAGKTIPRCVNTGCSREVAIRHWTDSGIPSLKSECTSCSTARKQGKTLAGIAFLKKSHCENKDGILGFPCPTNPLLYDTLPSDCYHMDHKDGNHENNIPENMMTLCVMCHTVKGHKSGDFNGSKNTSRKARQSLPPSSPEPRNEGETA